MNTLNQKSIGEDSEYEISLFHRDGFDGKYLVTVTGESLFLFNKDAMKVFDTQSEAVSYFDSKVLEYQSHFN